QHLHEVAMNGFLAYRDLYSNPFIKNVLGNLGPIRDIVKDGIAKDTNWEKIKKSNGLKELNSIDDLFGSQNYCECDSCQSVLSPAAYFVDLMRFIEERALKTTKGSNSVSETILEDTHPIHLKFRRPDLWDLKLTCENTNKHIPYIEIVNEVLSAFIQKHLGTDTTVSQRLVQENPNLEFSLPYNHSLAEVRTWLSHLNIKRIDLLEYLHPHPDDTTRLSLTLERLSLSEELYQHITNEEVDATVDKDVLEFRQKSELKPEEASQLVDLKFWDEKVQLKQIKNNSGLQDFKLEFSSSLAKWQGTMHRLIRLWKASEWNLTELDVIFQTFSINHDSLNQKAILNLGLFKELQEKTGWSVEELSGIIVGISQTNSEHKKLTWERLLPHSWVHNRSVDLDVLKEGVDEDAVKLLLELQGIFGINAQDVLEVLSFLQNNLGSPISFSLPSLDCIYRYIQLYKWSKSNSFDRFSQTLKIWNTGEDNDLDLSSTDILSFVDFVQSLPFDTEDLIYLFGDEHSTTTVVAKDKETLESEDIQTFIRQDLFDKPGKFELLFNKWLGIDTEILIYYKRFMEVPDSVLDGLLEDLQKDNPKADTYIRLSNIKNRLERLVFVFEYFKIDMDSQKKIAEKSKNYTVFNFGFSTWLHMEWIQEINLLGRWISETKNLPNFNLFGLLAKMGQATELSLNDQRALARWQKVSLPQVQSQLIQSDSIQEIQTIWEQFKWMKSLNMNSETLHKFNADAPYTIQSELLQNAIRSKFEDNDSWENSIQDSKNALSSKRRDALCNFVIFNSAIRNKNFGFKNRESLYQYFLLDVGMGDCFTLPRIVAATNSLQVYIHRCIMGLERSADEKISVLLDIDEIQEWEWRKNYRVWEANRKIFLFPENYAEAEIRDNKSPEFKELEDELLQQKLDLEVVEDAYKKYLEQIMTLAELRMAGAYFDRSSNRIYLFGKTNRQPGEFYFRHLEFLESGAAVWSNWEKMNIGIPTEDVSAIVYNGKLHVFWTTSQRKDISSMTGGTSEIKQYTYDVFLNYSYLKVDKKWSPPQKIEIGHRTNSPFDSFLRINEYKSLINSANSPTFKAGADAVRENALRAFEQTVYRKPYPMLSGDKKTLSFGFIWSDKKSALVPRYKKTNAIIDAFTVSVKIKVRIPWYTSVGFLEIEQDVEFSFDRIDRVVHTASNPNQETAPTTINIAAIPFTFRYGEDKLNFRLEFNKQNSGNYRFSLKTQSNGSNKMFFFKEPSKEVKSGDVTIDHQIDYVPVSQIQYESKNVDMASQRLIKYKPLATSSGPGLIGIILIINLFNESTVGAEYRSYYDGFKDFFVPDGTVDFARRNGACKIQQKDLASILTTPTKPNLNQGYSLNPGQIHMLWDKISTGIEALLDTQSSQRHVADQIDYSQSFGNYFFELFFHIPMRIADHLNAAGKYKEANYWYSFIYNPTAIKDKFEQLAFPQDVNWRFAAFRNIGIQNLKEIYSDPNTIEMYRRNPGNPHAIARLRIGAYQKHVVMKYLDNLLDWADNLFEQFTPESTSEARHLYSMVKTILGNKPQSTGKCGETKEITYSSIKNAAANEFIYNLFTIERPKKKEQGKTYLTGTKEKGKMLKNTSDLNSNTKYKSRKSAGNFYTDAKKAGTAAVSKVGGSKITNIKAIKADSRFTSSKPNKDLSRPARPIPLFNLEKDLVFCFPHNKDFVSYWDRVDDRIYKLNHCLDINGVKKVMPAYAPEIDPMLLARMV
ncbi:MAG TPA: neuraminidase-like domain-containing protein, partial [Sphingobacterium sp.]|nr:neuraminidase-like domain-containing protein [Sphingobacterium sp.]